MTRNRAARHPVRKARLPLAVLGLALLLGLAGAALGQRYRFDRPPMQAAAGQVDEGEFTFARLIYGGGGGAGRGWGRRSSWTTDWPEAEHFFMQGLTRLTRVDGTAVSIYNGEGARQVDLLDGSVYDYPFLYAVEVGYWSLSPEESAVLRDYLLRGGFMMVDDFHGTQEWSAFVAVMGQIFPERPIVDIPDGDEVFHVLYDVAERIQVPGLGSVMRGVTWERDGYEPTWRGIYDDKGRLMVAMNHNMDLGDAWEHADTPGYPEPMTALAYRFAVNYAIYSLTH